ncbi:lipase family protein [Spiractinospora alimapuensis]|uniref:lipase family protein n=1 Tax=Spiractinospora alimapuensis TaxID=2820884 RepID=UPI0022AAD6E8|nr:hypothetical protein [Spiractinospora alimapuensis]
MYTYGQPRTCDQALADAYDEAFAGRMFRFVNNNDVVPRVPPEPVYRHVAVEKYIDADGNLEEQATLFGRVGDSLKGHTADVFSPGTDAVRDHSMKNYLACLSRAAG